MQEYSLADRIPVGIFIITQDFKIVFWNTCFEDWTGIGRDSVLLTDIRDVFPRLRETRYQSRLVKLFEDGMPVVLSYQLNGDLFSSHSKVHKDRIHHCTITSLPGAGRNESPRAIFAVEDRTEVSIHIRVARVELLMRYEIEKELRSALAEKQTLMDELNHRVKNNLNIVRSLIAIQSDMVAEENTKVIFHDLEARISSISLLHEMLYKTTLIGTIALDAYLDSLCRTIFTAFLGGDSGIRLSLDLKPVTVSTDTTLHTGLIVSELLTNAIKYGMKGRRTGVISVSLDSSETGFTLEIGDDGPGLPAGYDVSRSDSLGMKLVYMITAQLLGRIELRSGSGAHFSLFIPK